MCTGRIDLSFLLRAFSQGADGVFIGGCHLNECNYITHGNFYALRISYLAKGLLARLGLDPRRLNIQFISGAEGNRFAELMTEFSRTVYELGPLGEGEGLPADTLKFRLAAATRLVPYVKLLERERFRVRFGTEEEYAAFFTGEEFTRLFDATIGEKLLTSQTVALLEGGPLTTAELAGRLGLTPSAASKHLTTTSRQGLVRYDGKQKRYALA